MNTNHLFRSNQALQLYCDKQKLWDEPLFSCKTFVAVPSVGALIEGWLLIVPRQPALSIATLSDEATAELQDFSAEVAKKLESMYGSLCIFEHGPSSYNGKVGCGVDYAHLHMVPIKFDLLAEAKRVAPDIEWRRIESLASIAKFVNAKQDYWFVQPNYSVATVYVGHCTNGRSPDQLFRRAIANRLGQPDSYDWKKDLGSENLVATVQALSPSCLE